MATTKTKSAESVMVGARIPRWAKEFYDRWAKSEERKPGFMFRKVLVDYAKANGKSTPKH